MERGAAANACASTRRWPAGSTRSEALDALAGVAADGRLLLVGHEPDLSGVIAELTGARVDLKKGGLAVVRLEGVGGELAVLMRPRELALIAGVPAGGKLTRAPRRRRPRSASAAKR